MIVSRKNFYYAKNFKNELIIKVSSSKAMLPTIKFGWILNISKPNKSGS